MGFCLTSRGEFDFIGSCLLINLIVSEVPQVGDIVEANVQCLRCRRFPNNISELEGCFSQARIRRLQGFSMALLDLLKVNEHVLLIAEPQHEDADWRFGCANYVKSGKVYCEGFLACGVL